MNEADEVYVLDTGSTDNTVELLEGNNVIVESKIIDPWRFDVARNESLKLVPDDADICVCTDLDEVFIAGWRENLEKVWGENTNRTHYIFNWSLDDKNNPKVSFYGEKIHSRKDYIWINPVHEILKYLGDDENHVTTDNIILNHYPDISKSRSSYLPLLELSISENPDNDRNVHYLGREYMYYQQYDKAIKTLKKHLTIPSATWHDERCASMRFIGRCYKALGEINNSRDWFNKAIREAPYLRDAYIEKALIEYEEENYTEAINLCLKALRIKSHPRTYINEIFSWNETVYDLLSICYYKLNNISLAIYFIDLAISINPDDLRLINNRLLFEKKEETSI